MQQTLNIFLGLRKCAPPQIPFSALAPIALSLFDIACCLDELNILHRNLNFEALRVLEGDINIAVGGLGHALILVRSGILRFIVDGRPLRQSRGFETHEGTVCHEATLSFAA